MATKLHNQFQNTVSKTEEWAEELADRLDLADDPKSYRLLCVTLHAIRDTLSVDEATDLSAQLPQLLRGAYFEGWQPSKTPVKTRNMSDLVNRVEHAFDKDPFENTTEAVTAVFNLLNDHVSQGEINDVRACLPKDIQEHWEAPRA